MRVLEEFWYGNIEPTEYDTDKSILSMASSAMRLAESIHFSPPICSSYFAVSVRWWYPPVPIEFGFPHQTPFYIFIIHTSRKAYPGIP